jgi:hypothetical protein
LLLDIIQPAIRGGTGAERRLSLRSLPEAGKPNRLFGR